MSAPVPDSGPATFAVLAGNRAPLRRKGQPPYGPLLDRATAEWAADGLRKNGCGDVQVVDVRRSGHRHGGDDLERDRCDGVLTPDEHRDP